MRVNFNIFLVNSQGVVAPPRKLFPNCTKVSLRTTHDWRIKFKGANEKHSSEQVLHFPIPNGGNMRFRLAIFT